MGDALNEDGRGSKLATFAMAAVAATTTELVLAEPGRSPWASAARAALWVGLTAAGHAAVSRSIRAGRPRWAMTCAMVATLAAFLAPLAAVAVRAALTGRPGPTELALLASLRNLGLGLVAMSARPAFGRLAALLSLFQMIAASSAADAPWILWLIVLYIAAGGAWMASAHWRGLRLAASSNRKRRSPAFSVLTAFVGVGLVVAVAAAGPTRMAVALGGLFPSSGGTDWDDPDARGGVNDGENEVKGAKKPESIGFADSDAYLESDRPSLYDAFNDMYGEPIKPKRQDRMMPLANENVTEQKENPAENLRGGREFSAVRRRDRDASARRPSDREAKALLYVKGPTPLHLGLATYDRFDGREWREQAHCNRHCPLAAEDRGGPWFRLDSPTPAIFQATHAHQIKIGTLDSSPLPAPPYLKAFRVGAVSQPDFFGWSSEGIVRMVGRTVPSSTVVETESYAVDPSRIRSLGFGPRPASAEVDPLKECACGPEVRALTESWAEGASGGWGRIEAVVEGLRRHAAFDPDAAAPADCPDVVEHFLLTSRRGPDYLFASAAVVLLRSMGHRARLVTGLYAHPDRYDLKTRHTPVTTEDVHAWAEVQTSGGVWIPVEPTPGYRLLEAPAPWTASLAASAGAAWGWAKERWAAACSLSLLVAAAFAFRRDLADAGATLAWRVRADGSPRRVVVHTLQLLETRARLGGRSRPPGETLRRWYGPIGAASSFGEEELRRVVGLAEWGLYSPADAATPGGPELVDACRRAVRAWTWKRFRSVARSGPVVRSLQ